MRSSNASDSRRERRRIDEIGSPHRFRADLERKDGTLVKRLVWIYGNVVFPQILFRPGQAILVTAPLVATFVSGGISLLLFHHSEQKAGN